MSFLQATRLRAGDMARFRNIYRDTQADLVRRNVLVAASVYLAFVAWDVIVAPMSLVTIFEIRLGFLGFCTFLFLVSGIPSLRRWYNWYFVALIGSAGIGVSAILWFVPQGFAIGIAGVLCGIAGAYLATGLQAGFVKEMTSGRGYIALAALIFAKWRPWHALGACLLFGLLQAVALRFQSIQLGGVSIPVQVMDALPYVLTVVILAGFVGKAIPPRAGGQPYVKER